MVPALFSACAGVCLCLQPLLATTDPLPTGPGFDVDHDALVTLVEQAQIQLEDYETLLEDYEQFRELSSCFQIQPNNHQIALELSKHARRIEQMVAKRQLKNCFTRQFHDRIHAFVDPLPTPQEDS